MKRVSVFFLGSWTLVMSVILLFSTISNVVEASSSEGDLRITPVVSTNPWQGRLEIYLNGIWGTICSHGFDINDATVACRRILAQTNQGLSSTSQMTFYSASYSSTTPVNSAPGPIWMTNVTCSGYESSLLNCTSPIIGVDPATCSHVFDVGITCTYLCPYTYQLTFGQMASFGPFCNSTTSFCNYGRVATTDQTGNLYVYCTMCNTGFYGSECSFSGCPCTQGLCSAFSSCATCNDGWTGTSCSTTCPCNTTVGHCSSDPNHAPQCIACNPGYSGTSCNQICGCQNGNCHSTPYANASTCASCHPGWTGLDCEIPCLCEHGSCSSLPTAENVCAFCDSGWTGPHCNESCSCTNGYCSTSPFADNICVACKRGWGGLNCDVPCCPNGACSLNPASTTATCMDCNPGFYGANCTQCSCPIGGGVCADGFTGTGECHAAGTLRLVGGTSQWNGLLEAWVNGQWGTMCSTYMSPAAATFMCGQLVAQAGFPANVLVSSDFTTSQAGGDGLPIVWQNFNCPPNATRFIECNPYISFACTHANDVGLICNVNETCPTGYTGALCDNPCTCKNGICESIRSSNGTCTSCVSNQWTGANCDIPCTCANGNCSGAPTCDVCNPGFYGPLCKPCNCTSSFYSCNDGIYGDGQCYVSSYSLRLVDGGVLPTGTYKKISGRVELFYNGYGFSPICSSTSTISNNDASVMCRQMFGTYGVPLSTPFQLTPYYTSSWDKVLSYCQGYETQLQNCVTATPGTSCSANTAYNLYCNVSSGCGNNVLDASEQCDGGLNCNTFTCTCPVGYSPTNTLWYKVGCVPTPVNCTWNTWQAWDACTSSCGSITRQRSFNPAKNNGAPCVGSTTEVRMCNLSECLFTCTDGSQKSLDVCSSQYSGTNSPCLTMTPCANYPSAVCQPDPCNSCSATFFVNGVKVDCSVHANPTGPPVTVVTVPPPPTGDENVLASRYQSGASVLFVGGLFMVVGLCFNFINFVFSL